ncbi:MAG: 2-oxo acid dehydrogenase subunit E2 [Gammaproteobacteria bacterium]|nr:2-oxo acid dehydrogenase subunit E2 [Gammaproteobacteria bacterium]MDE2350153.1 2-oxo acid dehydrogenase subunit E2 [Gammaproteobacteria bacterium]
MSTLIEVRVPDIGGFSDVSVIEVLVADGQQVDKESPLITLETEKAAMDVPSPTAGRVAQVKLKAGDKVSEGSLILMLDPDGASTAAGVPTASPPASPPASAPASAPAAPAAPAPSPLPSPAPARAEAPRIEPPRAAAAPAFVAIDEAGFSKAHASPSVRKFARELGADLGRITGTGPKGRVTIEDVKAQVKKLLTGAVTAVAPLPKVPVVDFAKFGPVEIKPLSRIQKISGARLQASWINLPHVTQHEDADITVIEAARAQLKGKAAQERVKLTPLAFIIKACVLALKEYPRFNASLDSSGENLVMKQYVHIGFAADTPNGLVVPVIRDADRCSLFDIARALAALSEKARAGKLTAAEMQGGCFTVSSLGGIGGTSFTPIINAPEVAILGVSRASYKPVFENGAFVPRLTLPLSLSYDHRVIDGAEAARFAVFLAKTLGDARVMQ